jgi:acetyl esterase/lipase
MSDPETQPDVVGVWPDRVPDNELWSDIGPEVDTASPSGARVIRNVGTPTLTAYLPDPAIATGAGVIVCPGGAFFFLAIDKEGSDVSRWLAARGIAAFVMTS